MDDVEELWLAYFANESAANRNALVEHYMPLVRWQAYLMAKKLRRCVSIEELTSYGVLGLMQAIKAFDPSRSKFETFASLRIRGAMLDQVRERDWVPRLEREAINQGAATEVKTVPLGDYHRKTVPVRRRLRADSLEVRDALNVLLSGNDRVVVSMLLSGLTQKRIGESLGLSEIRVSQIATPAIARLRRKLATQGG